MTTQNLRTELENFGIWKNVKFMHDLGRFWKHQFNTIARDKPLIEDIKLIIGEVPKNTILSIDFEKNWSTHSYFARYKKL